MGCPSRCTTARRNPLAGVFVLAALVGLLAVYGSPAKEAVLRFGHDAAEAAQRQQLPRCAAVVAQTERWGTDRHIAWFQDDDGQTRACRTSS